jgi:hypothetical protein
MKGEQPAMHVRVAAFLDRPPPHCGSIEISPCDTCSRRGDVRVYSKQSVGPVGGTVLVDSSRSCQACADVSFVLIPAAATILETDRILEGNI